MNTKTFQIDFLDLVFSMAKVVDVMSPVLSDHHMKVAYFAYRLAEELDLPVKDRYSLTMAGALHDIGAFSLSERLDLLEFEDKEPGKHSIAGYLLLKDFEPFLDISKIIKHHHVPWKNGKGAWYKKERIPVGSHIIHLADRIAVKISGEKNVLSQVNDICEAISYDGNEVFIEEHVAAMRRLADRDYIWLDACSDNLQVILRSIIPERTTTISIDLMIEFSKIICCLIDFKSEFTATHSSGVAATAVAISKWLGFSTNEQKHIGISAFLHDIGKLAVPSEILEKPGKLTDEEWYVMRSHVYYTHQILGAIEIPSIISEWSSLHQERLNGKGYPFGYKSDDLPLGARIITVADIFTALTEDRPYRKGMDQEKAKDILQSMADKEEIDQLLINIVFSNFGELNDIRVAAQGRAVDDFIAFQMALNEEAPVTTGMNIQF